MSWITWSPFDVNNMIIIDYIIISDQDDRQEYIDHDNGIVNKYVGSSKQ
jgi:hypothetical protein